MASHLQLLLFFFLITTVMHLSAAQTNLYHGGLLLGITKDAQTHQYTTQLLIGTPPLPTNLVLHLSGQSLWLDCAQFSSSRQLIRHGSLPCLMAKSCAQRRTAATICDIHQENPITGAAGIGDVAEDIVTVVDSLGSAATVDRFLFSCSPEYLVKGLATGAKGMLGFGRSKVGFQSQVVNSFDIPRKFTICLSSSDGFIISGTGTGIGISKSLSYTPLISTHGVEGYYVKVNSIRIKGRKLVLHEGEQVSRGVEVEISTIVPYTRMKSWIYGMFTKAYVKAAIAMNMTMVAPVVPFGVCFRSQGVLPEIELVFQSEVVKWRIQGMVQVSESVMCLGFVDGGLDMNGSVVLGGYQLEDHTLEFNLGTGMMGFSPEGKSCCEIRPFVSQRPRNSCNVLAT